jgi:hypothetical protein
MKPKLLKVVQLLREPKAYNNIQYVLGMLESIITDLEIEEKKSKFFKK